MPVTYSGPPPTTVPARRSLATERYTGKDYMKRLHVTFEEFELSGITDKVLLDNIKGGQCFIAVDAVGSGSKWPVFERTETGYLRRESGKVESYIPDHYSIYRLKE